VKKVQATSTSDTTMINAYICCCSIIY